MAPLPVKKAPARRRKDFPAVTNACAAASARSSRWPCGFRLALAAPLRRTAPLMLFRASPAAFRRQCQTEAYSSHPLFGEQPIMAQ